MKFGVISKSPTIYEYEKNSINNLLTLPDVKLEAIIIKPEKRLSEPVKYKSHYGKLNSLKPHKISQLYESPIITLNENENQSKTTEKNFFEENGIDFFLALEDVNYLESLTEIPKYGTWQIRHGPVNHEKGNPTGFWEIYDDEKTIEASLLRLTSRDTAIILKRGILKTTDYSFSENLDKINHLSTIWPKQVAKDLIQGVADYLQNPSITLNIGVRTPNQINWILFSFKLLKKILGAVFEQNRQWNIGVINKPIEALIEEDVTDIEWFSTPPRHLFVADQFAANIDNKQAIFVEEYDFKEKKGKISYYDISDPQKPELKPVIEKPYHMSYPYIFSYKNELYCIPETYQNKKVTMYKLHGTSNWEEITTILPGIDIVDPSIIKFQDRWWLFFTRMKTGGDTNLYLYYSEDPMREWTPHNNNPVKTDIHSSRPGGSMFIIEDTLYRPTQNCSKIYGGSIMINKVTEITPYVFKEETVKEIELPPDKWAGAHTLSAYGAKTLIDGAKPLPRDLYWFKNKILRISNYLRR